MFFNEDNNFLTLRGKKYYKNLMKEWCLDEDFEPFLDKTYYNNTVSRIDQEGNSKIVLLKPGLKKEYLKITLEGKNLNINYTIPKENKLQDFECDSFEQKWILTNENVKKENVKVSYQGGILIVFIEKSSPSQEHQVFEIPVE